MCDWSFFISLISKLVLCFAGGCALRFTINFSDSIFAFTKIILQFAARPVLKNHFPLIMMALLDRRQFQVSHFNRGADQTLTRTISPQRLIYYRDNWYLDAWCHLRHDMRLQGKGLTGGALEVGGRIIHMCTFRLTESTPENNTRRSRIARASRRRDNIVY